MTVDIRRRDWCEVYCSFFEILISGSDFGDAFMRAIRILFHTMNVVEPMLGFIFVYMIILSCTYNPRASESVPEARAVRKQYFKALG